MRPRAPHRPAEGTPTPQPQYPKPNPNHNPNPVLKPTPKPDANPHPKAVRVLRLAVADTVEDRIMPLEP